MHHVCQTWCMVGISESADPLGFSHIAVLAVTQSIKPWNRQITTAEDHTRCYFCQLRTEELEYNLHGFTKIGKQNHWKKRCLVWWVEFCLDIQMGYFGPLSTVAILLPNMFMLLRPQCTHLLIQKDNVLSQIANQWSEFVWTWQWTHWPSQSPDRWPVLKLIQNT